MALIRVLGQAMSAGTCPQPFLAHQPFDAVQPDIQPFGKNVMPDPTGTIGAIGYGEARTNPGQQYFIIQSLLAGRAIEPGEKARTGDTERLTNPRYRPDHSVLRDEPEPYIESLAK